VSNCKNVRYAFVNGEIPFKRQDPMLMKKTHMMLMKKRTREYLNVDEENPSKNSKHPLHKRRAIFNGKLKKVKERIKETPLAGKSFFQGSCFSFSYIWKLSFVFTKGGNYLLCLQELINLMNITLFETR